MIRDDASRETIATRVADREAVPWNETEDDPTLRHLRWIERIGEAYRDSATWHERNPVLDEETTDPSTTERRNPSFTWGPLDVLEEIGRGSSATVYRAFDRKLQRMVALKLFDASSVGAEALEEARRLARVRHPHLLTVFGADTIDGRSGLWTESIVGMDLEDELRLRGCWSPAEAIEAGLVLCDALSALHDAGLAHGDLTPRNVLRERGGRLVVTDLGASTDARDGLRQVGLLRTGTPFAMTPECLRGKPTEPRDDLYALGVLLYQMLTDHHPVEADTLDELQRLHEEHGPLPIRTIRERIPGPLTLVIDRSLDRDPSRRFDSPAQMRRALAAARTPRPSQRRARVMIPSLMAAAAAIALMLHLGIGDNGSTTGDAVAVLLSSRGDVYGEVGPMQPVRVGERLHLELELEHPEYVYVLNEDGQGEVNVLFPLAELDRSNPIAPGTQRLPGTIDGRDFGWQVTSAGGEEHVLVLRADEPLPELEEVLALLPRASSTLPPPTVGLQIRETLRGMAGLAPSTPDERAGAFLQRLVEEHGLGNRGGLRADLYRFVSVP